MKRTIVFLMLAMFAVSATAEVGHFTYMGTFGGSKDLTDYGGGYKLEGIGLNTYHQVDFQVLSFMAIGFGYGYSTYKKPEGALEAPKTDYVLLAGRLLIPHWKSPLMPYLIGGVGIHPQLLTEDMGLTKHAMGGIGLRYDLNGKPGGAGIDLQTCMAGTMPLTADFRIGFSVSFGKTRGAVSEGAKVEISATPAAPVVAAAPSTGANWWSEPFSAPEAFNKLKTEIIPARVQAEQLDALTAEVKPFFLKLHETGMKGPEYSKYGAAYFTAVAVELQKKGDSTRAFACLDKALKFVPDHAEALSMKASLGGATTGVTGAQSAAMDAVTPVPTVEAPKVAVAKPAAASGAAWWDIPFTTEGAFEKLKTQLIPQRVKEKNLEMLGKEAKLFFDKIYTSGVHGKPYVDYRAGYLTATAASLYQAGDRTRGSYYLEQALKISPAFQPALDLKATLK